MEDVGIVWLYIIFLEVFGIMVRKILLQVYQNFILCVTDFQQPFLMVNLEGGSFILPGYLRILTAQGGIWLFILFSSFRIPLLRSESAPVSLRDFSFLSNRVGTVP